MSEQAVPSLRERLAARNRPAWQQAVPQPVVNAPEVVRDKRIKRPAACKPPKPTRNKPGRPHCATCGVEVPGLNMPVRYCKTCYEAREKAYHVRRYESIRKPAVEWSCAVCGVADRVADERRKYCSIACRKQAKLERERRAQA